MSPQIPDMFAALSTLFQAMDKAWDETAAQYGFVCKGCEDNCCLSLFYHHTLVEKAYLLWGFDRLGKKTQQIVLDRAEVYVTETFSHTNPVSQKLPCPLLFEGRCGLYTFRPMICRMHGLPHELHRPGHPPAMGKGCAAGAFDALPYIPFDRTPFYREMARIELAFRQKSGGSGRIKESVAQILLSENRPWSDHPGRQAPG